MSLFVASLNSGSNGNCYYIGGEKDAILIDSGISCREIEKRMKRLGLRIADVRAVFLSHEHADHVHGVSTLQRRHGIPVYCTPLTLNGFTHSLPKESVVPFTAYAPVRVGSLVVTPVPVIHDARDPHNFMVSLEGVTVGVFTDIGTACDHVKRAFAQCHAAFLEANYDEEMLMNGRYPWHLKNRIRGGKGHLSNREAASFFARHRAPFLSHVFLSHLSRNNNTPELAQRSFYKVAGKTQVIALSRYRESALFNITRGGHREAPRFPAVPQRTQLSLF